MNNPFKIIRPSEIQSSELTAIDFFSGAGGLTLGLANAGFNVLLSSDHSTACAKTHRQNLPTIPFIESDVRSVEAKEVLKCTGLKKGELDLLAGGPPCQGFSIIGARAVDDPRNGLFREFMRLAVGMKPKVVVMENVPGLATLMKGAILAEVADAFDKAGYVVTGAELVAAQYGVPQMRWRYFLIGWRKDLLIRHGGFPQPTFGPSGIGDLLPNRTLRAHEQKGFLRTEDAIRDLPALNSGECNARYAGKPSSPFQKAMRAGLKDELWNHYAPALSPQNLERIAYLQPGQDWRDLPYEMLPEGMKRANRKDHTRRYRRMTWDGVPRSIITRFRDPKSGEYSHPEQTRTISIREAARIQSFPDWFRFEGGYSEQYDQVGNAVPVLLAKAVAAEVANRLRCGGVELAPPPKSRYSVNLLIQPSLFADAV